LFNIRLSLIGSGSSSQSFEGHSKRLPNSNHNHKPKAFPTGISWPHKLK